MLKEVEETSWLHGAMNWNDWQFATEKPVMVEECGVLLDNVSDDKLARDVDDLSAIFEELAGEVEEIEVPVASPEGGAEQPSEWISDLDADALNIDEISDAFEVLAAEQEALMNRQEGESVAESGSEEDEEDDGDEVMDSDEEEECGAGDNRAFSVRIIPAAPTWISSAPIDPRSCIRSPVFKDLDSRIPRVNIPRIDFSPPTQRTGVKAPTVSPLHMSPKADKVKSSVYKHDPSTCWICKSDKSEDRKRALHRYQEKRTRRNWKKGPRYSGRSNVATSRVRNGGRFICTAQWI
ncbi:TPA: hypothetical protein N0F65_000540 [Lagenidium giganteum]|uniref:CCT domain-containing protein n=1 Tax=Lagenidium giganteum TaxID=4803 RepID=A0AAV2Z403_9STRA|nr:TPA: hypothetical protein N0F65_000540 [Lagenidium giganteum]